MFDGGDFERTRRNGASEINVVNTKGTWKMELPVSRWC